MNRQGVRILAFFLTAACLAGCERSRPPMPPYHEPAARQAVNQTATAPNSP